VDAYNLGLIAPTFLATATIAWLQMTFIGRYAALIATDEDELAAGYRSGMLFLMIALTLSLTGLCALFPEKIVAFFLQTDRPAVSTVLRLSSLILIPIVIGDFLALVLNGHGRFLTAALAPLLNGLVSVLALWLWPRLDLSALVWTLVLGSVAQGFVVVVG